MQIKGLLKQEKITKDTLTPSTEREGGNPKVRAKSGRQSLNPYDFHPLVRAHDYVLLHSKKHFATGIKVIKPSILKQGIILDHLVNPV